MPPSLNTSVSDDQISLRGLGLTAHIGVPAEERLTPQRLELDADLWPAAGLREIGENLARTIDYAAVADACRALAAACPRQLIETLAEDLCRALLARWPLARVRVCVRKFILPDTRSVAVTLTRTPEDFAGEFPA